MGIEMGNSGRQLGDLIGLFNRRKMPISNNVGGIKRIFRAHFCMHPLKSAISLAKKVRVFPT
jgi:hypothetical protein